MRRRRGHQGSLGDPNRRMRGMIVTWRTGMVRYESRGVSSGHDEMVDRLDLVLTGVQQLRTLLGWSKPDTPVRILMTASAFSAERILCLRIDL